MESSRIGRPGVQAFTSPRVAPSQGQLLAELIADIAKHVPASGTKNATATEIGEALKLQPADLKRFEPLVTTSTVSSTGALTLALREEFRFKPDPDASELILSQSVRATVSPGKLLVEEGLGAKVGWLTARISSIEVVTEESVRGVRISTNLGDKFYPI